MNLKIKEIKERIKLNAEYRKYSKLILKKSAPQIHHDKYLQLKNQLFTNTSGWWKPNTLYIYEMRYYHIAYSLLKGRTYEQIENKVHVNNILTNTDWQEINNIMNSMKVFINE